MTTPARQAALTSAERSTRSRDDVTETTTAGRKKPRNHKTKGHKKRDAATRKRKR